MKAARHVTQCSEVLYLNTGKEEYEIGPLKQKSRSLKKIHMIAKLLTIISTPS